MRYALEEAHLDRPALLVRQRGERRAHELPIDPRESRIFDALGFGKRLREIGLGADRAAADHVESAISRYARDPRAEISRAKQLGRTPDFHEHRLSNVFGRRSVAKHPHGQAVGEAMIGIVERLERIGVALADPFH